MSTASVITQITAQELAYAPTVVAAVQATELLAPNATGPEKLNAVVQATSQSLAASPNPNVANIAALVSLTVLLANLLNVFKHKAASPAPTA